jgi:AcrR family transcriptional regulator
MPRPKSDTREKIINSARTLFRRQGYHGTGLAQIIEHSGTPRGSMYFLFPGGKEQVAVAAVTDWTATLDELIRTTRADSPTLRVWIERLATHFADELRASDFTEGLPVTTITLDSVPASAALTTACRTAYDTWLATLTEGLLDYGVPEERADGLAKLLLAGLEGAAVLCRAYESTEPLDRIVSYVLSLLP